jgi:MFS family permease
MTFVGHRVRLGAAVTAGAFIFPVALLLFAAAPHYAAAAGCLFIAGIGMMAFNMVSNTILQQSPPDELRGRVMSLRALVFVGLAPLGNLQIGAMGYWFGPQLAVAAGAAVSLIAALVAWWRVPNLRRSA